MSYRRGGSRQRNRLCISGLCAALAASLLSSCAIEEEGEGLVPEALGSDHSFDYYLDGDMAIAEPRTEAIFLASGGTGPKAIFLNFAGGTIHKAGWAQNNSHVDSSFIPSSASTIPAFDHSPWGSNRSEVIQTVVDGVADDFSDYGVEVTSTRPTEGTYTMIMVGGYSADIGMTKKILGVAPLDVSNWNANDVGFVFSESASDHGYSARHLAHVISHELGHSLGLRHLDRHGDIMRTPACHCAQSWGVGTILGSEDAQDEPAHLASIFPPATNMGSDPIGRLESISDTGVANGWACDTDAPDESIDVQLYAGGIAGSGADVVLATADEPSFSVVSGKCGGGNAHRFLVQLDVDDHCGEPIHVYGVNASGTFGSTVQLSESPKSMPACEQPEPPASCGAGDPWIETGTHDAGMACGDTCGGYHWSWCDYDGDGSTSDGWQYCLSSGWAPCQYHPH